MSGVGVTSADDFRMRALAVREQFAASGTNISDWARERKFSISLVQSVLAGQRPCRRGESHRIAVALGIKRDVPPPGESITAERLKGVRP